MANLEAGNDDQLIIRDLVESFGLTIGITKGPNMICAVSTLEQIFKKLRFHGLKRVLRLIIGAWEGDMNSFSANMLNAVAKLVDVFGDTLDDDIFKEKLGQVSIKQLIRTAKDRRAGSMGVAEAMIIEYNGKKKNNAYRLHINKLYAKEHSILKKVDGVQDDLLLEETSIAFDDDLFDDDSDE